MHTAFYLSIITWESLTMLLSWWGGWRLARAISASPAEFHQAKRVAISALTLALLMWLVAFLSVGGEWFLMWQSKTWNGQEAAFRFTMVILGVLIFLVLPDRDK